VAYETVPCSAWRGARGCRGGAGGVIDLLVEDVVVAVDAVGLDGEQDRDAVPGAGSDLGGVAVGVHHSDKAACRRS
jgi:hypothetical protein